MDVFFEEIMIYHLENEYTCKLIVTAHVWRNIFHFRGLCDACTLKFIILCWSCIQTEAGIEMCVRYPR